ncbi:transcriptional regulator, AsnC family [Paenibacillus curdlanolyticus YK9]|uniref:Transcriptional regulator, AsnC family n=1 Tax=Paenibacillus curdlanolyticus YK9 TaxID=717606 RepID=E0ICV3_9BACL|nr:Lrp/AsnC family transcriptional regulator [Paenibacillus curdlanolyticus]EFM09668.1 transcriptional regulator, AsnC family [Paenibacillus curdlanolyticus YK9]
MANQTLDDTDLQILQCLIDNSLRSHKEIGQLVHLSGQAVGARVRRLHDLGVIDGYTLRWNPDKIGQTVHAFVTVFMKSNTAHTAFLSFARSRPEIIEVHRVSGEGCYWMRVRLSGGGALNALLDEVLAYGNYKLSLSIEMVK